MNRVVAGIVSCVMLIGAPAFAADLALKAPPPAPVSNWAGFYLGIEGGGGFGTSSFLNLTTNIASGNMNIGGGIFGGTYGYNWQAGRLVYGLEGDISWTGIKNNVTPSPNPVYGCGTGCVTNLQWLGTDRVRVGLLPIPNILVYATGGVAYGTINAGIFNPCCDFENHTRVGYTVGGGVEGKLPIPGWTVKAEYLYVDFGGATNFTLIAAAPTNPERVFLNENIFRVGVNYQLPF